VALLAPPQCEALGWVASCENKKKEEVSKLLEAYSRSILNSDYLIAYGSGYKDISDIKVISQG